MAFTYDDAEFSEHDRIINENKYTSKSKNINQKYKKKKEATQFLEPDSPLFKPAILESVPDADSPKFTNVLNEDGLPSDDRSLGYDSAEAMHNDKKTLDYFESYNGKKKLARQRSWLDDKNNLSEGTSTNNDVFKEGERQRLQYLYEAAKSPGDAEWTPGPIEYNANDRLQLGSEENPLGIEMGRATNLPGENKFGVYKRPLTQVLNPRTNTNLNKRFAEPDVNTDSTVKNGDTPIGQAFAEVDDEFSFDPYSTVGRYALNAVALAPEVAAVAADAGIWVYNELNKEDSKDIDFSASTFVDKIKDNISKFAGFNDEQFEKALDTFQKQAVSIYEDESTDNATKAKQVAMLLYNNANMTPDLLAQSIQFVKQMAKGLISDGSKTAKSIDKFAGKVFGKGDGFVRSTVRDTAAGLAKGAGVPRTLIDMPETIAEFEKNNNGEDADIGDIARLFGGQLFENKTDAIIDRTTMGMSKSGKALYNGVDKVLGKMPITDMGLKGTKGAIAQLITATVKPVLSSGAKGTGAMAVESTTEAIQDLIHKANVRYDTDLYKDKEFLGLFEDEAIRDYVSNAASGALGSVGQTAVGQASSYLKRDTGKINETKFSEDVSRLSDKIVDSDEKDFDELVEDIFGTNIVGDKIDKSNVMEDLQKVQNPEVKKEALKELKESIDIQPKLKKKLKKSGKYQEIVDALRMSRKEAKVKKLEADKALVDSEADEEIDEEIDSQTNTEEEVSDEEIKASIEEIQGNIKQIDESLKNPKETEDFKKQARKMKKSLKKTLKNLEIELGAGSINKNLPEGVKVKLDTTIGTSKGKVKAKMRTSGKGKVISEAALSEISDENLINLIQGENIGDETSTLYDELSENSKTSRSILDKMFKPSKKRQSMRSFISKAAKAFDNKFANTNLSKTIFTDMNKDGSVNVKSKRNQGTSVRLASIALKNVLDGMKATIDIANERGEDIDSSFAIREEATREIGKQFYSSQGMVLTGNEASVNQQYMAVGEAGLSLLDNMGLIDSGTKTTNLGRTLVDKYGDFDNDLEEFSTLETSDGNIETNDRAPIKNTVVLKDAKTSPFVSKGNRISASVRSSTADALQPVLALFNIGNQELPKDKPNANKNIDAATKISGPFNDIVKKIQEGKLTIKQEYFDELNNIKSIIDSNYKSVADAIKNDPYIRMFFGGTTISGEFENLSTSLNESSIIGQTVGIVSKAEAMLNALEDIDEDNMYYSYFSAVNKRLHPKETTFEFQGDNAVARHILTPGDSTIDVMSEDGSYTPEFRFAIEYVCDELGIDPNDAIAGIIKNDSLDTLLDAIEDGNSIEDIFTNNRTNEVLNSGKSPIAQLELVRTLHQLMNTTDGKATISGVVSGDANFSGFMNTVTNIFGLTGSQQAEELMEKIGWSKDEPISNITIGDAYQIITDRLKEEGKVNEDIREILEFMTENMSDKDMREFSKQPLMTFVYGQQEESRSKLIGQSLFITLAKSKTDKARSILNKAIDDAKLKNAKELKDNLYKITITDKNKIAVELGKNIGKAMSSILENISPDYQVYKSIVEKIYNPLSQARVEDGYGFRNYDEILLRDPFIVTLQALKDAGDTTIPEDIDISPDELNKTGFSIEKMKAVALGKTHSGSNIVTEKFMPNENSAKVMPQQATDTAILLISYIKTLKELGYKIAPGTMPIHDAVYSDPRFAVVYKKHYNQTIPQVAEHYDFINEMLHEANRALKYAKEKDSPISKHLKKVIASIEDGSIHKDAVPNKERLANKKEFLDNNYVSGFGTHKIVLNDETEPAFRKRKPKAKKPKAKSKKSNIMSKEDILEELRVSLAKSVKEPNNKELKDYIEHLGRMLVEAQKKESEQEAKPKEETKAKSKPKKEPKIISAKKAAKKSINTINDPDMTVDDKMKSIEEFIKLSGQEITENLRESLDNIKYFLEENPVEVESTDGDFKFISNSNVKRIEANPRVKSIEEFFKLLNHEVEHRQTYEYLFNQSKLPVKEQSAAYRFATRVLNIDFDQMMVSETTNNNQYLKERLQYILTRENDFTKVAELVAIFRAEPQFRKELEEELGSKGKVSLWKRLYSAIESIAKTVFENPNVELTMDSLTEAMNSLAFHADKYDATKDPEVDLGAGYQTETLNEVLDYKRYPGAEPLYFGAFGVIMDDLNKLSSGFIYNVGGLGYRMFIKSGFTGKVDSALDRKFKIYGDVKNMAKDMYAPGSLFGKLAGYLEVKKGFDYDQIRKMQTAVTHSQQIRSRIDSEIIAKAKKNLDKVGLSSSEMNSLSSVMSSNIGTVGYIPNSDGETLIDHIMGNEDPRKDLNFHINRLEGILGENTSELAKDLSIFDRTKEISPRLAIIGEKGFNGVVGKNNVDNMNILATLYAIKSTKNGLEVLAKVKKKSPSAYKELMMVASSAAYAAKQADKDKNGKSKDRLTNRTGSKNIYKKSYEFKVVTQREQEREYKKEDGWIIVKEANYNKGILGVVARESEGFGIQTGVISSVSLNNDALYMSNEKKGGRELLRSNNNALPVGNEKFMDSRIVLTNKELSNLEIENNPFDSLYRGLAHNQEVFEIKKLYSDIIKNKIYKAKDEKSIKILDNLLSRDAKDGDKIPLFLSVNMKTFDELPESIKRNYMVPDHISNVMSLHKEINLVHKDFKDTLSGYTRHALVSKNNPKLYKAEKVWRHLITMFKAHVVMGNPTKIAGDSMSNLSILLANDVPLSSIAKYGREAIKLNTEMTLLRNQLIDLKIEYMSAVHGSREKEVIDKKITRLQSKIKKHPFSPALNNGFIQSIGTDMMTKEQEAISGLKVDLDKIFDKVIDYKGVRKSLKWFANAGVSSEDVLRFVNDQFIKNGSSVERELDRTIKKLKSIKKDGDMKAYLHQIIATPGSSEIIRHGGNTTLYVDLMSRWIMYKHAKDMGMSEKEAVNLSLSSFIDYRTNLPSELEMLSALGIWMFPQFTLKIQRVIWQMLINKPLSSTVSIGTAAATNSLPMHISSSNAFNKNINTIDGLDGNMVAPYEFWSF